MDGNYFLIIIRNPQEKEFRIFFKSKAVQKILSGPQGFL